MTQSDNIVRIVPLRTEYVDAVARLHIAGITEGFIASLGPRFVRYLYQGILAAPGAFSYVAEDSDGQVLGFISCAESVGQIYKQVLKRNFLGLTLAVAPKMVRPRVLRNVCETLLYPSKADDSLPPAELLSIVVDDKARGMRVGARLVEKGLQEFHNRGVERIKVMVGAMLPANAFYLKMGFVKVGEYAHHGHTLNAYTIDTTPPSTSSG